MQSSMESGVSASTIDRKLAGLAFLFKLHRCRDYTKEFWVKQAVKGYRRAHKHREGRCPVSFSILHDLFIHLSSLCSSDYKCSLFWAAFALAFFGAFRVGKLFSSFKWVHGGLLVHEVACSQDSVSLWV